MIITKADVERVEQKRAESRERRRAALERLRNQSVVLNLFKTEESDTIDNDTSEEVEE